MFDTIFKRSFKFLRTSKGVLRQSWPSLLGFLFFVPLMCIAVAYAPKRVPPDARTISKYQPVLDRFPNPAGAAEQLDSISDRLGVSEEFLLTIIYLETAGSMSTDCKAKATSALGLGQFLSFTRKELCDRLNLSDLKSQWSQLRGIEELLKSRNSWCNSEVSSQDELNAYLAIFKPHMKCSFCDNSVVYRGKSAQRNPFFSFDEDINTITVSEVRHGLELARARLLTDCGFPTRPPFFKEAVQASVGSLFSGIHTLFRL